MPAHPLVSAATGTVQSWDAYSAAIDYSPGIPPGESTGHRSHWRFFTTIMEPEEKN